MKAVRDFTEGAILYVPVFVKGALFWTGDSHAAQGNGEVNLTALETAYKEFNVTLTALKNVKLDWPRIETPTHWITMGFDRDLNLAWTQAALTGQKHRRCASLRGHRPSRRN